MIKAERYSWDSLDANCKHMRLPLDSLRVGSYQRGEVSDEMTIEKAKHLTHTALGALIVARRNDGSLWIVDGLQRKLAAQRRGDITDIDCMVFDSSGEQQEAEVFLLCNKGRANVSAIHKYLTAVTAHRSPEFEIDTWLKEHGFSVRNDSSTKIVSFPSHIVKYWSLEPNKCKRAILLTSAICESRPTVHVFLGVVTLLNRGIDIGAEVDKIINLGGKNRIAKEINSVAIISGKCKSPNVCAAGILNVINYRRRTRIML